jgi:hypothetical protein
MKIELEEAIVRRLSIAKLIVDQAKTVGLQYGPLSAGLGISLAQDALEMILRAALEHWKVGLNEQSFEKLLDFVDKTAAEKGKSALPERSRIGQINKARVSFKHHGVLPDQAQGRDLILRAAIISDLICESYFGIDLGSVTLANLVAGLRIRNHLLASREFLDEGKHSDSILSSAKAFALEFGYAGERKQYQSNRLEVESLSWGFGFDDRRDPIGELSRAVINDFKNVSQQLESITKEQDIIKLGIDPHQMAYFSAIAPSVSFSYAKTFWCQWFHQKESLTSENAEFCLSFAASAIIRAQSVRPTGKAMVGADWVELQIQKETSLVIYPEEKIEAEVLAVVKPGTSIHCMRSKKKDATYLEAVFEGERCYVRSDAV